METDPSRLIEGDTLIAGGDAVATVDAAGGRRRMARDRWGAGRGLMVILPAAALLLWPAVWNGYPIVFADTGTYLSQAIQHYAGWDRPVFYSLFMLPLHATISVWPVVVMQAVIATYVLSLVARVLVPKLRSGLFIGGVIMLAAVTWLPWLCSELMPDLFTPLVILLLALLGWTPERLSRGEQLGLAGLAGCMIATQLSSLPMTCGLIIAVMLLNLGCRTLRFRDGPAGEPGLVRRMLLLGLPPALAVIGLCSVNLAAHGRFAISPFGNVFLLARLIYDGPGMMALRQDCPAQRWRLCPYLDRFPADSDGFLWNGDSPLRLAGGAKLVAREADAIIGAAWRADAVGSLRAGIGNTLEQLVRFESGDGLQPWPSEVSPWVERDFPPRERAVYAAARQQLGELSMPAGLAATHRAVSLLGIAACGLLLPAAIRRRSACLGFLVAVLLALPLNAAITGALSAPHDRYQSRIMWLPPFVAVLSLASLRTGFGGVLCSTVGAPQRGCGVVRGTFGSLFGMTPIGAAPPGPFAGTEAPIATKRPSLPSSPAFRSASSSPFIGPS